MKNKIIVLLLAWSPFVFAQNYANTAEWMFFGRQPSAKTEAMGRILTLNYEPNFLTQSNPAALTFSEGAKIFYSQSSRLYMVDDASYYFAGVSYNTKNIGAFAFNIQLIDWGKFSKTSPYSPTVIGTFRPTDKIYTFTYSNELKDWFSYGISANLFAQNYDGENTYSNTFFEIGILKEFKLFENSEIKDNLLIGTQMKNIFNQGVDYDGTSYVSVGYDDVSYVGYFPSIFRVGISNVVEYTNKGIYQKSHLIGFTSGFEYQDLFNSKYRTAYKLGGELSLLDIVYLRIGYYYETLEGASGNSKKSLEEFTYGFGFNFNLVHYLNNQFPMSIKLDYINLPQPSYVTNIDDWDNFNTFSLIINYRFY